LGRIERLVYGAEQRGAQTDVPDGLREISAYEASYNAIVTAKMADRQAYKDFNERCEQLFSNPTFAHSVLEKYRLTAYAKRQSPPASLAAQTPPAQTPPQRALSPLTIRRPLSANDEWIYPRAFPLLLLCLLPIAFCTWAALQLTGSGHQVLPTRPPVPGGLPALPESLRVVSVPGVRYAVYVLSGIVLEKEENERLYSFSSTTPAQTLHMGGGHYQYTPAQTSTYTESVREQIIWVRSPEGREQSWTLYNSDLRLRPGQLISALVRPLPKDTGDILMIYNHTTGTVDKCRAMEKAHGNQGFIRREIVQWTANLACGVAAAIVTFLYLPLLGGGGIYPPFAIWWVFGSLVLITLSFLIVTPWMTRRTLKRRDAAFDREYLPGLRQFFEQGTPILQRAFGRA